MVLMMGKWSDTSAVSVSHSTRLASDAWYMVTSGAEKPYGEAMLWRVGPPVFSAIKLLLDAQSSTLSPMLSAETYGSHVLLWPFTSPHITVFRVVGNESGFKFCTLSSPAADRIGGT